MRKEIKHGIQVGITPEVQSEQFIFEKLDEERAVSLALTPHHDQLQECIANTIAVSFSDPNAKIVELGTGTGASTKVVLETNLSIRITGVDSSKKRLERARVRLQNKTDRIDFINQDFKEFISKVPEDSIDCVFTAFTLHNLPLEQRREILISIATHLKRGGIFIDGDKHGFENQNSNNEVFNEQIDLIRTNFSSESEMGDLWEKHYREDFEMDEPREVYKRFLESIGFEVIFKLEYGLEVVVVGKKV